MDRRAAYLQNGITLQNIKRTYYFLPTTYYLLPTTYYLLPTTYYLLPLRPPLFQNPHFTTPYFPFKIRYRITSEKFPIGPVPSMPSLGRLPWRLITSS